MNKPALSRKCSAESLMFQWRVTKYDPALRDERGYYTGDEWTHFAQVGTRCDGALLTMAEYERVESTYLDAALAFVEEAPMPVLFARGVERGESAKPALREGDSISTERLRTVIQGILREEYCCRLEGPGCYIHFCWDYYMFIGAPRDCPKARALAHSLGLFVEECASVLLDADEQDDP